MALALIEFFQRGVRPENVLRFAQKPRALKFTKHWLFGSPPEKSSIRAWIWYFIISVSLRIIVLPLVLIILSRLEVENSLLLRNFAGLTFACTLYSVHQNEIFMINLTLIDSSSAVYLKLYIYGGLIVSHIKLDNFRYYVNCVHFCGVQWTV